MKPILEIQNVSKKFSISHHGEPYLSFRDRLVGLFKVGGVQREDFWALRDVSFNVEVGESVGIIGRNGAGKSTLLKILSKITPPTHGRINGRGRVASLLEVGTGFHMELTGKENIYMNGSILGMKKAEINNKFDEIVEFSGTEKFLDTPLKHYSSGMQLRLAFAVAAHLEPEILIIDEVLAVGDAEFQKKCLGKMEDVTRHGRTILFVSHNMGAVSKLCNKAILLREGRLVAQGATNDVIAEYSGDVQDDSLIRFDHPVIRTLQVTIENSNLNLEVGYQSAHNNPLHIGFVISDQFGNKVCGSNPKLAEQALPRSVAKAGVIKAIIKNPKLNDGVYKFSLWAGDGYSDFFHAEDCLSIKVENMINRKIRAEASMIGSVIPEVNWIFEEA
ncbi:MAG: polysaccharide ABC transporter ATP-binding protein [Bacteroidota bacterium]